MALLEPTATADLAYDWDSTAPADGERSMRDDRSSDPLNAARGMALAAALGGMMWAVILWGLL
jgi:hypothetical protein